MEGKCWISLRTEEAIDLELTLFSGQVFSFKRTGEKEYTGVLGECLVSFLQDGSRVLYKVLSGKRSPKEVEEDIFYFFTLDIKLKPLLEKWKVDSDGLLNGLRALRYDLIPTIFSFICSSNNNISRITRMVEFLYSKGEFIMKYKGIDFHRFPSLEELVSIEGELKAKGFGYRSSYICNAATYLQENYSKLQQRSRIREALVSIKGVGEKIADCILLIGVGELSAVPIDTHIFKHSKKMFRIHGKTLTRRAYGAVQELYKEKFGEYAGIAQLYIFKRMVDQAKKRQRGIDRFGHLGMLDEKKK
ncbi:8-oxoguanine DNA glycosylase [Encephalitozoon intestinalis ATCC 50506]|uniref:DNA-(apurinic or apyrimidinic site) lyase n=1 Tax=Encephalitozoon intestinalis (strain ATCC 50506) TaxID=876142 RepID=E0S8L3_ENCIT|nr:8-oxoguanine DNA glycosylase [Encephalitozoon intestinalis ATCC 50506]ADM12007.1 8-oxoguanine DNA glycosylase [Encephalitozoon intestinalis ATCC 50506]UTX45795.1 8-oxoguanine DNA glycosylase [Encephalitozoon intestinalis]